MGSERLETLRRAFWVALVPGAALFLVMQVWVHVDGGMVGADSHAYWLAARDPQSWYSQPPAYRDAYLYSPAFAQLLWPLGHLPWRVFEVVWAAGQVAVLTWLLAPLGWRRALTLAPFVVAELLLGNLYVFFAGALVHRAQQAQKEHHELLAAMRAKDWARLEQTIRAHNRGALADYGVFLESRLAPAATKGDR